jgi:hypothetical protein
MKLRFAFRPALFAFIALLGGIAPAQDPAATKVMVVEKLELAPGLVTSEIAKRFHAAPLDVEARLRGAVLATLSQELSSSKMLRLAVRDESLDRLVKEWKVSEELGSGSAQSLDLSVASADLIAFAKIEDFVADYSSLKNAGGAAAKWRLRITVSLEITERNGGTRRVLKEDFEHAGSGIVSSARLGVPDFDSGTVRKLADGVTKKLGVRVLDLYCPPKILSVRGRQFIVDRGRMAGMREGQWVELSEFAEGGAGTDAAFPVGKAVVKSVKEETSILELVSVEEGDLATTEIKKTYTVTRLPDTGLDAAGAEAGTKRRK